MHLFILILCMYSHSPQGLLFPVDAVSTPYSYRTCVEHTILLDEESFCSRYMTIEVESASLVPPFTYNNQCASAVLTSYIPVFLLGYSIQLMLSLIILTALTYVSYDSLPFAVRTMLHGIMWPEYWLQDSDDVLARNKAIVESDAGIMLKIRTIFCNDVLNNWLLLLTFGLCSPVLAVAIVCAVLLKMSLWVMLIGRFTRRMLHNADSDGNRSVGGTGSNLDTPSGTTVAPSPLQSAGTVSRGGIAVGHFALTALATIHISLFDVLKGSFWLLVWFSGCAIYCLHCWLGIYMAMDDVGWWLQSVWIPII